MPDPKSPALGKEEIPYPWGESPEEIQKGALPERAPFCADKVQRTGIDGKKPSTLLSTRLGLG